MGAGGSGGANVGGAGGGDVVGANAGGADGVGATVVTAGVAGGSDGVELLALAVVGAAVGARTTPLSSSPPHATAAMPNAAPAASSTKSRLPIIFHPLRSSGEVTSPTE